MNRSIIAVLLVLLVGVVAVGFYRGWFTLSSQSQGAGSNKVNISLTVDPDKVKADAETVQNKATQLPGKVTQHANELGHQATDRK
jgi:hypothetical protein